MTDDTQPRSIGSQAIVLAAATGVAQVIVAVMYIVAARIAGPADYGLTIAAIAVGTALVGYADFGTNSLWVRDLANGGLDVRALSSRARGKLLVATVGGLVLLVGLLFTPFAYYWIAVPILLSQLLRQTSVVPLRAAAQSGRVALVAVAERVLGLVVLVGLFAVGVAAESALWMALTAGSLFASGLARRLTPPSLRFAIGPRLRPSSPYVGARHYGLFTIGVSSQSLDLALLSGVGGAAAAGLYGAVNRWTQPMGLLANAFSTAAIPFVAKSPDTRAALRAVSRGAWLLGLAIAACVIVFFSAPWIVPILVGNQYVGAVSVLQILALGTIPGILNQPLATFLQAIGRDRVVSFVVMGSVVLQLGLILLLAGPFGALGAAGSMLIVQTTLLFLLGLVVVWVSKHPNESKVVGPKETV